MSGKDTYFLRYSLNQFQKKSGLFSFVFQKKLRDIFLPNYAFQSCENRP